MLPGVGFLLFLVSPRCARRLSASGRSAMRVGCTRRRLLLFVLLDCCGQRTRAGAMCVCGVRATEVCVLGNLHGRRWGSVMRTCGRRGAGWARSGTGLAVTCARGRDDGAPAGIQRAESELSGGAVVCSSSRGRGQPFVFQTRTALAAPRRAPALRTARLLVPHMGAVVQRLRVLIPSGPRWRAPEYPPPLPRPSCASLIERPSWHPQSALM